MYYFIVNDHGGSGRAAGTWNTVQNLLNERQTAYKVYMTAAAGDATRIARELTQLPDPEIPIVVVGGDGTINEVLNGIADFSRVRFGLIPTGSGNDFARGLGIPRSTEKALRLLLESDASRRIDIGRVTDCGDGATVTGANSRLFAISSGMGMDAIVCKRALTSRTKKVLNALGLGGLTYKILTVLTLARMKTEDVTVTFDGAETVRFSSLIFLAAMNMKAEGGGVPMAPRAEPDDGQLTLFAAHDIPKWRALLDLLLLISNKHEHIKGVFWKDFKSVRITAAEPQILHTDGEYGGDMTDVLIECVPAQLRMLV